MINGDLIYRDYAFLTFGEKETITERERWPTWEATAKAMENQFTQKQQSKQISPSINNKIMHDPDFVKREINRNGRWDFVHRIFNQMAMDAILPHRFRLIPAGGNPNDTLHLQTPKQMLRTQSRFNQK